MKKPFALSLGPPLNIKNAVSCRLATPQPLEFHIEALCDEARISDLVPVARKITDIVCRMVRNHASSSNISVACRKGCAACCRFLVPVSVAEAACIAEEILSLPPKPKEEMLGTCLKAAGSLLAADPLTDYSPRSLSQWYAGLNMKCPLLRDNLCMMYESRPLACREHLVTGPACSSCEDSEMRMVEMPISVTSALAEVTASLDGTESDAVMLPLALPWYEGNADRAMRLWPATVLAGKFASTLLRQQPIHAAAQ